MTFIWSRWCIAELIIGYGLGETHLFVAVDAVFGQETGADAFSGVCADIDEPADDSVGNDNEDHVLPPVEVDHSLVDINWAQNIEQSHQKCWSHKPVVFHGVESAHKLVSGVDADVVALAGRVAEGFTWKVDVAVGIGSDEVEEEAAAAFVFAGVSQFSAAGAGVAGEEFDEKSGDFEETVEEGACNDATPVSGEESGERAGALGLVGVPVPVGGATGDAEVDWVRQQLQASLRNWKAQMNSMMLRTPRAPGLEKSQRSELATPLEEKARCWNMKRAMSPAVKNMKSGM